MARFNLAWLLASPDPEITLSRRARYQFSDPDLFRSAENAEQFTSSEPEFRSSPKGLRLTPGAGEGRVWTHKVIVPSAKLFALRFDELFWD